MKLYSKQPVALSGQINLPGSKSISHRALICCALSGTPISELAGLSDSDDTQYLKEALLNPNQPQYNMGDGATPLRFFLAYKAAVNEPCTITGSNILLSRPHQPLIEALTACGAEINVHEHGISLIKGIQHFPKLKLEADSSSQHVSAMMLVAPKYFGTKHLSIGNNTASLPYLEMTASVMQQFGVHTEINQHEIQIHEGSYSPTKNLLIEADWSSAAFFYSLAACIPGIRIKIPGLSLNSAQGDRQLSAFYASLGVKTYPGFDGIQISNEGQPAKAITYNLINHPDCAPALMSTCAFLGIEASFVGIHNLKDKESNRIKAMEENLGSMGIQFRQDEEGITLLYNKQKTITEKLKITTFKDHRIAMGMAIFGLKHKLYFDHPECVSKSFPNFWQEWSQWFNVEY